MNKNIYTKIAQIHEKVKKNVALQKYIEEENKKLQIQSIEYQKIIKELNNKIIELTEQNKIIKMSKALENKKGSTEVKLRINELVREIDKCKSLLNR
jgi:hypothetical protein